MSDNMKKGRRQIWYLGYILLLAGYIIAVFWTNRACESAINNLDFGIYEEASEKISKMLAFLILFNIIHVLISVVKIRKNRKNGVYHRYLFLLMIPFSIALAYFRISRSLGVEDELYLKNQINELLGNPIVPGHPAGVFFFMTFVLNICIVIFTTVFSIILQVKNRKPGKEKAGEENA